MARQAWAAELAGLEEPSRLTEVGAASDGPVDSIGFDLESRGVNELARTLGVTVNTIVQAAWGILLGRLTGRADVVFGATVAGRPPELPGAEDTVGLFISTIPVRVRCAPDRTIAAVLTQLQDAQAGLIEHQHLGLAAIQREAGLGELFDSLIVFENYPDDDEGPSDGLAVTGVEGRDATTIRSPGRSRRARSWRSRPTTAPP